MDKLKVCVCLLLAACQALPERGAPCAVGELSCCAGEGVEQELRSRVERALACRFEPCDGTAVTASLLCVAELELVRRGRRVGVLTEEARVRRDELLRAVRGAEAAFALAREGDDRFDLDLGEAALLKAKLALSRHRPRIAGYGEVILFCLHVAVVRGPAGRACWEDRLYACGCGRPVGSDEALQQAAREALGELEEQLRLTLNGKPVADRIARALEEAGAG